MPTTQETISDVFVTALSEDAGLAAWLKDDDSDDVRIYAASSLGVGELEGGNPAAPDTPYMVWNELPSTAHRRVDETSNAQHRYFTFYVYAEMGQLGSINAILRLARNVLKHLAPFETTEEGRCIETRWMGLSGFADDAAYAASSRFATVRMQCSE